ncbi:hypothetical protein [Geomonas edaphica]|uniref:hypothetical protein n=1 Tax=Geomonas edaphica TaxID=2570226 RepID=UPI0010A76BC7|nr:hypothetical protein [Geomonas edaphica]
MTERGFAVSPPPAAYTAPHVPYTACLKVGREPTFRNWDGEGSLVDFVIGLNLHRRHLTDDQKSAVAFDMIPLKQAEAKERQREAGIERAASAERDGTGQLVTKRTQAGDEQTPLDRAPTTRKIVADAIGISERKVQDIINIAKEAPEKVEEIKQGKATVKEVMREVEQVSLDSKKSL